mmetsp:Transcript_20064/g.37273  ORF Transcript_20064/g.37273 Transcript_20064/m.37273 type:complete len:446 (-) Transcript_20064:188-1525(-)
MADTNSEITTADIESPAIPRGKRRIITLGADFDEEMMVDSRNAVQILILLAVSLVVSTLSGVFMLLIPAGDYLRDIKVFVVVVLFQACLEILAYHLMSDKGVWRIFCSIAASVLSVCVGTGGNYHPVVVAMVRGAEVTIYGSLFIGFSVQVFMTIPFTEANPCHLFKYKLAATLSLLIPPLQYLTSNLFGDFLASLDIEVHLKLLICLSYPLLIGLFKTGEARLMVKNEDLAQLFEFYSFLLAALPFRFLYFQLTSWLEYLQLLVIKFLYKTLVHFMVPKWSKSINKLKCKCKKSEVDPDRPYFAIGEKEPLVFSRFMTNIASKLAFHQFNDTFDIVMVLILMSISYGVSAIQAATGVAKDLDAESFLRLFVQFIVELFIEITFTICAIAYVSKLYPDSYHPLKASPRQVWSRIVGLFSIPITLMLTLVFAETFLIISDFDPIQF